MNLGPFEQTLAQTTLAPYIVKAMAMIDRPRKAGSNMFRHQMSTMAILLDYKIVDPVLLKAALIHDLFEELRDEPWVTRDTVASIDADGPAVYALVQEVTRRVINGLKEPKGEYLARVMQTGSERAKTLKLADRISNLITLGFVTDQVFVERTLVETRAYILPHAAAVSADMKRELSDLLQSREEGLARLQGRVGREV
jgi:(p)ppGpp synthase/HD superfamily hydrolase